MKTSLDHRLDAIEGEINKYAMCADLDDASKERMRHVRIGYLAVLEQLPNSVGNLRQLEEALGLRTEEDNG